MTTDPTSSGQSRRQTFEVLEPDEIELVSIASGRRATLDVAMRERWVVCLNCNSPYDPEDIRLLREDEGDDARCVSDVCRHRRSPLQTGPLPVDQIVVFAQAQMHEQFRDGLIFKLFYADDQARRNPNFILREETPGSGRPSPLANLPEPTVKEENWSRHGLVITKRRRGKFVSWVPIGS